MSGLWHLLLLLFPLSSLPTTTPTAIIPSSSNSNSNSMPPLPLLLLILLHRHLLYLQALIIPVDGSIPCAVETSISPRKSNAIGLIAPFNPSLPQVLSLSLSSHLVTSRINELVYLCLCLVGDVPERFSVASYNILGDRNASQHSDLYVNVPSRYINWDRRKRVISNELFGWDPDILCLQVTLQYHSFHTYLIYYII